MAPLMDFAEKLSRRIGEPQAFSLVRHLGRNAFQSLGWPSKKLESWRYSPTQRLQIEITPQINNTYSSTNLDLNEITASSGSIPSSIKKLIEDYSHPHFYQLITLNGQIVFLSPAIAPFIEIETLQNALVKGEIDSSHFQANSDSLEALNISFFDQGFLVKMKEHTKLNQPLHWIQCFSASDTKSLFHERILFQIGAHAQCSIITSEIMSPPTEAEVYWCNSTYQINIDQFAKVEFLQWSELSSKEQSTSRTTISLNEASQIHFFHGSLSEGWSRRDISISAKNQSADIKLHGLGFSKGKGIIDQQTKLEFLDSHCVAEQICKNLLLDQSRAIFNGCIHIHPQAQKTDSSQLHKSLLLSTEAEVDTKPQLEIFADDVKATHGAAIGQLNPDEIFYLRSRGLTKDRAHALLCQAFLLDLCERFNNDSIKEFLRGRLHQFWENSKV